MNALEAALYTMLTGGTALTALLAGTASVYNQRVPSGAAYPCVVFGLQGGGDDNETPRRSRQLVYTVKGITETGPADAGTIDDQCDALLHGATLSLSGDWGTYWIGREGAINYQEVTGEGDIYTHVGALYRIRLAK